MLTNRERVALDRYITGNFGEDQFDGGMEDMEYPEGIDCGDLVDQAVDRIALDREAAQDLDADRLWDQDPGEMDEILRDAWADFDRT